MARPPVNNKKISKNGNFVIQLYYMKITIELSQLIKE